MMTSSDEARSSRGLTSLVQLGKSGVEPPTPAELEQGLAALRTRIATAHLRRRRALRGALVGTVLLLSAVVVLRLDVLTSAPWSRGNVAAFSYEVVGGNILEGGYLRASGGAGVQVAFNEGSRVRLASGTRGRIRSVDDDGARMAIESGTAQFQITPGGARQWGVEVGPFLVTVKGTVFTVSWEPESERFELRLAHGRVDVSGPVSDGRLALRAGQRLVVDLAKGETRIIEDQLDGTVPEASAATEPVAEAPSPVLEARAAGGEQSDAPPVESASLASPRVEKARRARRWAEALANGDWDTILDDVERTGVAATLNRASSGELYALADAARYRRRAELARDALLAQRRRFPGSLRALFLLGRVEESRGGGMARAIAWYDEYLARTPRGVYAAEALGRKMTITSKLGGPAKARPLAEAYLRRFPGGSYAGSARAILRAR